MSVSARLARAADAVAPQPGERVLEVGCGQGVLVGALADRIGDGHVVGLDRSAKMITVARRVQGHHVAARRVSFVAGRVQELEPTLGPFDAVVAARVREMTTDASVLPVVRAAMATGGRLLLMVDSPAGRVPDALLATMADAVSAHGFTDVAAKPGGPRSRCLGGCRCGLLGRGHRDDPGLLHAQEHQHAEQQSFDLDRLERQADVGHQRGHE